MVPPLPARYRKCTLYLTYIVAAHGVIGDLNRPSQLSRFWSRLPVSAFSADNVAERDRIRPSQMPPARHSSQGGMRDARWPSASIRRPARGTMKHARRGILRYYMACGILLSNRTPKTNAPPSLHPSPPPGSIPTLSFYWSQSGTHTNPPAPARLPTCQYRPMEPCSLFCKDGRLPLLQCHPTW